MFRLHCLAKVSSDSLHGLPLFNLLSIVASSVCFGSLLSSILCMWPNSRSFLFIIIYASVACTFSCLRNRMSTNLIISSQLMFSILLLDFISNANKFFLSISFKIYVSKPYRSTLMINVIRILILFSVFGVFTAPYVFEMAVLGLCWRSCV